MEIEYMHRALELSKQGIGFVNPNPLVGALIVKDNKIIGEGFHEYFGGPHAEINAFSNATQDVQGAIMYVTLEPCSHYGKTPPCANAIVKAGINKVIIGMKDPNPQVAGRGIAILENNGIEVECGVLEDEIKGLNEVFIKYITTRKPFCVLKTAMTLDGKIATTTGHSQWISNSDSRKYVHELRHQYSGIMVGINTVLADNPSLTTRRHKQNKNSDPVRIVVDSKARIPLDSKILNLNSGSQTIIACTEHAPSDKIEQLKQKGAEVIITTSKNNQVNLDDLMMKLGESGIDSVLLEGGSSLNFSALKEGIVDRVLAFIAPKIFGGQTAKTPVGGDGIGQVNEAFHLDEMNVVKFMDDILISAKIKKGGSQCLQD